MTATDIARASPTAASITRRETVFETALVPERHPLASLDRVAVASLEREEFVMFPRDLAPRLHDALLAICRRGGFEPTLSRRAFHSAGDTGTFALTSAVALAPESVADRIPGVLALPLTYERLVT